MDFGFDATQLEISTLASDILRELATPERVRDAEAGEESIDRDLWMHLARADLLGVALPTDVGGSGYGIMELGALL